MARKFPVVVTHRLVRAMLVLLCCAISSLASETVLHNFIGQPHGASPESNLISDAFGNLYGTTYSGGNYGYGTVFELCPTSSGQWKENILYSFTASRTVAILSPD